MVMAMARTSRFYHLLGPVLGTLTLLTHLSKQVTFFNLEVIFPFIKGRIVGIWGHRRHSFPPSPSLPEVFPSTFKELIRFKSELAALMQKRIPCPPSIWSSKHEGQAKDTLKTWTWITKRRGAGRKTCPDVDVGSQRASCSSPFCLLCCCYLLVLLYMALAGFEVITLKGSLRNWVEDTW